jgi:hypothetical protein
MKAVCIASPCKEKLAKLSQLILFFDPASVT